MSNALAETKEGTILFFRDFLVANKLYCRMLVWIFPRIEIWISFLWNIFFLFLEQYTSHDWPYSKPQAFLFTFNTQKTKTTYEINENCLLDYTKTPSSANSSHSPIIIINQAKIIDSCGFQWKFHLSIHNVYKHVAVIVYKQCNLVF